MPELSVILPCYNESGNLLEILSRYRALVPKIDLELVLVDNGSTDGTAKILEDLLPQKENNFVRVVRVASNVGYGHGIQAGLQAARGTVLAFSHADLQCDPEDILTAMEIYRRCAKSGLCLIKGCRRGVRPPADRAVTWIYNHVAARLLHFRAVFSEPQGGGCERHVADVNAQPKLFPRLLLPDLLQGPVDFTFDLYVLLAAHRRKASLVEFIADYKDRRWGRSKLAANPWVRLKTSLRAMAYMLRLAMLS